MGLQPLQVEAIHRQFKGSFTILHDPFCTWLQYITVPFGDAQYNLEQRRTVVNINKWFAQLHCLLGFGAKLETLSVTYQPFWIFGPFWSGVHQQGPGSLQISTAEAPSPWQTSRAPQGANDSFVWKSRGCQACFTKKEESPHEVETFFKDTGCVKQNFELQVKT